MHNGKNHKNIYKKKKKGKTRKLVVSIFCDWGNNISQNVFLQICVFFSLWPNSLNNKEFVVVIFHIFHLVFSRCFSFSVLFKLMESINTRKRVLVSLCPLDTYTHRPWLVIQKSRSSSISHLKKMMIPDVGWTL